MPSVLSYRLGCTARSVFQINADVCNFDGVAHQQVPPLHVGAAAGAGAGLVGMETAEPRVVLPALLRSPRPRRGSRCERPPHWHSVQSREDPDDGWCHSTVLPPKCGSRYPPASLFPLEGRLASYTSLMLTNCEIAMTVSRQS